VVARSSRVGASNNVIMDRSIEENYDPSNDSLIAFIAESFTEDEVVVIAKNIVKVVNKELTVAEAASNSINEIKLWQKNQ
jgi:hypothetical protein